MTKLISMSTFLVVICWCILFVLCWPLAIAALLLWPIVWLIALPFRLIGWLFMAIFSALKFLILLPFMLFGWRPNSAPPAHA